MPFYDAVSRRKVLVWDLPLRVFHWLLAASFVGAYLTAESERLSDVHAVLGYTMLTLVAFRLVWGLIGTRYARFSSLPFSPRRALAYLRTLVSRRPEHHVGHNPAGSLAIYALLALSLVTAGTGLAVFADLGGKALAELHEGAATAMLVVVIVHVAGVLVGSLVHRENLAAAMVTGRKHAQPRDAIRAPRRLIAAALAVSVLGLWTGLIPTPGLELQQGLTGISTPAHAAVHARHHYDDD